MLAADGCVPGGLKLQAWGLILVIGGTALSSAPALAQASSPHPAASPHVSSASRAAGHTAVQAAGSVWAADVPGWITAMGTALLAIFAILTTVHAIRAFRKQSQEVSHQAEMLKVHSEQLAEQRKLNDRQMEVLALQATEPRESLEERKREAVERRNAQAAQVHVVVKVSPGAVTAAPEIGATVVNASERQQPVYDVKL